MTGTTRREAFAIAGMGALGVALAARHAGAPAAPGTGFPLQHSDAEWRKLLPPAAYQVLRHEDTEAPFTSPLLKEHRAGLFACAGCARPLFDAKTKFESGTGWPSFWAPLKGAVATRNDSSLMMERTEVHCTRCGGHLGHVFEDGPKPTGLRYCMNGVAMRFLPARA